ncbi:ATP-binding protein [Halarsenatibacter silvermanii]|uniref:histidine kinase n=1 Tax=Halarsenatibacter silvermanii TaxID=321763 RepID=A0A1G9QLW3_9FIRM|nr:ATP-binding protein [Halarsenatibacter silvermanii]SDM11850.1 Histidine kinase-, DNA gyrase B-, and HSP90-like ATPase [Halarsenatibacter silvermanii]
MRELSLHLLDIAQNSIRAGAGQIEIKIKEDVPENILLIVILDDGRGIDEESVEKIVDPFVTTRKTREVGLGLSLFKETAELCGGSLRIDSKPGEGTSVTAEFEYDHLDRPPLGSIAETLVSLIAVNPDLEIIYQHQKDGQSFYFSTGEVKAELQDVDIQKPRILKWLEEYLRDNIAEVRG